ncbi:MAG: hypothetical protein V7K47_14415 [Nostoc sp.]
MVLSYKVLLGGNRQDRDPLTAEASTDFVLSHLYFQGHMTNDKGRSEYKNLQSGRVSA